MRHPSPSILMLLLGLLITGCAQEDQAEVPETQAPPRFTLIDPAASGLHFANQLTEGPNTNILMYEYFYNGGGVATADFDGDGLTDLYFTGNMTPNHLYLNRGDLRFEEVTEASGTAGRPGPWTTGVTVVDLNADGRPDLYVSNSGMLPPDKRRNQLFLNERNDAAGIPVFREAAAEYGLDLPSFTNQAYFVDYDGDGDLDALMLNHNPKALPILNVEKTAQLLGTPDPERGLRLYRNDGSRFTDVTEAAGLNGSALSYGLGLALTDLNDDGFPDSYVSNDYEVPDYLYVNNGDGTFTDQLADRIDHTSHFSMGSDIADVNNDGAPDIFTLDMLPDEDRRRKLLMADDNRSRHDLNRASGFPEQRMRNMLQLNRGDGTFAEVGQLAGVAATDWSWSALLADLDNDGFKDLHVTNGYVRDYTNMDFIKYMDDFVRTRGRLQRADVLELLKHMEASEISNFAFANTGGYAFEDRTAAWGLQRPSNSNGAVAADLDNDGDLDLVVSNNNGPAFLYKNGTEQTHFLQVQLSGDAPNTSAIGAVVTLHYDSSLQRQELYPNRGYLSAGPTVLHFGLGAGTQVPRLTVRWPGGKTREFREVAADQRLTLTESDGAEVTDTPTEAVATLLEAMQLPFNWKGTPVGYRDFDRQALLPREISAGGPTLVAGDVNGDGREDLIVGNQRRDGLQLFTATTGGGFTSQSLPAGGGTADFRYSALALADFTGDGVPDLYVGRGGYHALGGESAELKDMVLVNDGGGNFRESDLLPALASNTSTVAVDTAAGQRLLFVGGYAIPGSYPLSTPSYLLEIDKEGKFQPLPAPLLDELGLVTDAIWADLEGDGTAELIVAGEWMPIRIFSVVDGAVSDVTEKFLPGSAGGWWNTLAVADFNGDGRLDLLAGNEGSNNLFGVTDSTPASLYAADQDGNGSVDPLFSYYVNGELRPDLTRDELVGQLAKQRGRYPDYKSYAGVTTGELVSELKAEGKRLEAGNLATTLYLQREDGRMVQTALPVEAQYAPVHVIIPVDVDRDGDLDLILAGNESRARLRYGSSDANHGILLRNDGDGHFSYVAQPASGLNLRGDVRSGVPLGDRLLFGVDGLRIDGYRLGDAQLTR